MRSQMGRLGALLLVSGAMIWRCGACGPDFPNWLLGAGDSAVLRAPEAWFGKELQRMRLVTTTNVARLSANAQTNTVEMDLADLRQALARARRPAAEIDSCLARYRAERLNLANAAGWLTGSTTNAPRVPQIVSGLPPEFADYFRGAWAWHQTNLPAARAAWNVLLERPPAERRYKSTWAAFMLAKSWEEGDAPQAIRCYRRVRDLARLGFADSLGLAVESLGWEARLEKEQEHYAAAIDLYLEQYAAGDPTAENSLRFVAAEVLERGQSTLERLARHPRAQRLITAYVISGGYRKPDIDVDGAVKDAGIAAWEKAAATWSALPAPNAAWHHLRAPARMWLQAVESARVRDVESAEQLALASYQMAEMGMARRWLAVAKPSPAADWVRAKLLLRDGKVAEGTALLAKVSAAVPPAGPSATPPGLADSLFLRTGGEYSIAAPSPAGEALRGEMAVVQLSQNRYIDSLDSLLQSSPSYWMDAAYVAERLLDLDELKSYVDRHYPEARDVPAPVSEIDGMLYQGAFGPAREAQRAQGLRYLLARRLARAHRFAEARAYYPAHWVPLLDQLCAAWQRADNPSGSAIERSQSLLQAAVLTRKYGLELIGTELAPDWRIHAGDYQEGVSPRERAALYGTNALGPTALELQRAASNGVLPEQRWHYRTVAAVMGWEAARLLRQGLATVRDPGTRLDLLFAASSTLASGGVSAACFDQKQPALSPADLKLPVSRRVARTLAGFPREEEVEATPPKTPARFTPEDLWAYGDTYAALDWEAALLLPDNSDRTARLLSMGRGGGAEMEDLFYKALVRRCPKTAIGAAAARLHWFPPLDKDGNLLPPKPNKASAASPD